MIATPMQALQAAAEVARKAGITPLILSDSIEGESRDLGTMMAGIARSVIMHGLPAPTPVILLSGGETTVTLGKGKAGRGGRNTEFLLAFAAAAEGLPGIWALAGDSDGIDGTEDAAGAIVTPDTLQRGREAGLNARDYLAAHDSYNYFQAIGDLVITGPTLTNVNDIRAVLVTKGK
jgi:glycerate 2-kinase